MGIMQFKTKKFITSKESIVLAADKISKDYAASKGKIVETIVKYNPSYSYAYDIERTYDSIQSYLKYLDRK